MSWHADNVEHRGQSCVLQVAAIKQGTTLVLECRRQRRYDLAALTASEKLLKVVPEVNSSPYASRAQC